MSVGGGKIKEVFSNIKLGDVMVKPVVVVDNYEEFSAVEELFITRRIHHLPVVNTKGKIVGLISQRDVYRRIAPRRSADGTIIYRKDIIIDGDGFYEKESLDKYILNHVMQKNPKTLTPENTLAEAIHLMVEDKIACVPIVDEKDTPIGIITRFDILKLSDND